MTATPTPEELLAQIAALQRQLAEAQARQAQAEQGSIATAGDGNISVGGPVLGSIYQVYQAIRNDMSMTSLPKPRVFLDAAVRGW